MPSIFPNSQNFTVNGGQFIGNINRIEVPHDGLDQLRQHTSLEALLDSTERFDPPKCAPNTRNAIIDQILDWVTDPEEKPSVMWLYGPAGAGKSALAQTVAEILRARKHLMASFFFSRTAANRSDGRLLVPTLSYQLLLSLPATRNTIKQYIESDPTVLNRASDTQMERLLVEPINQYALSWFNIIWKWAEKHIGWFPAHHPRLIVIDGLDECQDPMMQSDLLRVIGHAAEHLEYPVKFLVSCRPESHIIRIFNHDPIFQRLAIPTINLAMDLDADRDIQSFIQNEFDEIKRTHPLRAYIGASWPGQDTIRQLVRKASGQFIYASTVTRYIQSPKHRPDDRLNIVLGLSPPPYHELPFSQLDALYTHIFSSIERIDIALKIFGVLIIPRKSGDGLGRRLETPKVLEQILFLRPGDVLLILEELRSIVVIGDPDAPIRVLHASLADYLSNPSRSGRFYIDSKLIHSFLARGYLAKVSNITSSRNVNPTHLQSALTTFISHSSKSLLTKELQKEVLSFDFMFLWGVLIGKCKSWLVLNPFYFYFLVSSLFHMLSGENFRQATALYANFTAYLEELNIYLVTQLKSTVIDNYLGDFLSRLPIISKSSRMEISFRTSQYLCILCELFSWDYNSLYSVDRVRDRYARAVHRCLEFVTDDSDFENLTKDRRYREFPILVDFDHKYVGSYVGSLNTAHLDCAIALFPHAGHDRKLLDYLKTFTFSSIIFSNYHDRTVTLNELMIEYKERVKIYSSVFRYND